MGLIRITVDDRTDITAVSAKLHVQIEGETFVMGNAAMEKAREVRDFVAQLQAAGVLPQDIHVQGVKIASSSGLLAKNQKVEFQLVVRVNPAQLPDVLGAVAAHKNMTLKQLEWVFDEFEASIPLAAQAMKKARRKADALAEAAGHRVTGVHSASDSWDMPVSNVNLKADSSGAYGMMRAQAASVDVGVEYSATQQLSVHLTVDFTLE